MHIGWFANLVVCKWLFIPYDSTLGRMIWLSIKLHFRKMVIFGDQLKAQETNRGWESGSFLTACLNTLMRVILGFLV